MGLNAASLALLIVRLRRLTARFCCFWSLISHSVCYESQTQSLSLHGDTRLQRLAWSALVSHHHSGSSLICAVIFFQPPHISSFCGALLMYEAGVCRISARCAVQTLTKASDAPVTEKINCAVRFRSFAYLFFWR